MPATLYVTASFVVKPEALDEILEHLAALSLKTREEPGCLEYGYFQSLDNPLQISSFERWKSEESEATHWQTEHLATALARVAGLLQTPPQISKYRRFC